MSKTIKEIREDLDSKKYSSEELTKDYLKRIKNEDGEIHAFLDVFEKEALLEAKDADERIKKGEVSILTGIPCAIKDNILIKGKKCTAGSKMLENYIASYDASVVLKLKKQGVVFLGKTNMDEFAMGSSTENSYFGVTKNPYDLKRVPGGSSGGSAAALAAEMCAFSLGSDTGGSIRQPASFCDVVGLKPTYGSVSRSGLIAYASSLDQIGPFGNCVADVKTVFDAIKGKDSLDSTSLNIEGENNLKNIRIGIPKEYFEEGLDSEVKETVLNAIEQYRERGAEIVEISLPHSKYALACYYIIATAEASANLSRFDGIRYGFKELGETLNDIYVNTRTNGFGEEVKKRIMLGTYTLSSGYYDAYYKQALKARSLIKKDFEEAFEKVDAIMGPVSPILPFKIGEKTEDPLSMYLADIYTTPINLAGLPAISIPLELSKEGLPQGLHIITSHFSEEKLFKIASLIQWKKI
ncbi:MAG: Asp-tRNA(Asn)/Glu-tRNA(Gln) amidotransferase subunit GatA [Candidatus Pacebacteria bacterium]|nr:Asp-tRNA(Asn)/Glu-tRNA(Gln) amidotransferase subunit GatA [Candidatus Paceibacterota bacterium]